MDKKGFTLIELLIVVAIVGILAMIAIPMYVGQEKRAARTEAYTNLQNLRMLEESYYADNGCYYMKGSPPACANTSADIPYKGTYGSADGGIEDFLPGFKPGPLSSLNYSYKISVYDSTNGDTAGAFKAFAVGKSSRVKGDNFWIDNNNNRNF